MNRLEDSFLTWKYICDSKLLAGTQLILYVTFCVQWFSPDQFFWCAFSFLNKIDLLSKKLESGVRFDKYVVNYGNHPNDVTSVTSCEFLGGGGGSTSSWLTRNTIQS